MRRLWKFCGRNTRTRENRRTLFMTLTTLTAGAIGLAAGVTLGLCVPMDRIWLLCFAGWPALLGLFGSRIWLLRNE